MPQMTSNYRIFRGDILAKCARVAVCAIVIAHPAYAGPCEGDNLPSRQPPDAVLIGTIGTLPATSAIPRVRVHVDETLLRSRFNTWVATDDFEATTVGRVETGRKVWIEAGLGRGYYLMRTYPFDPSIPADTEGRSSPEGSRWFPRKPGQWIAVRRHLAEIDASNASSFEKQARRSAVYLANDDVQDAKSALIAALADPAIGDEKRQHDLNVFMSANGSNDERFEAKTKLLASEGKDAYEIAVWRAENAANFRWKPGEPGNLWQAVHEMRPKAVEPMMKLIILAIEDGDAKRVADLAMDVLVVDPHNVDAQHALFNAKGGGKPGRTPLAGLKAATLDLQDADLHGEDLTGMAIDVLKAAGADLTGARLDGLNSKASEANKIGPLRRRPHNRAYTDIVIAHDADDLRGVANDLRGARLSGASFRAARLEAPRIADTVVKDGDFTDAFIGKNSLQVVGTKGSGDYAIDTYGLNPYPDIVDVTFDGTVFRSAGFHGTRFRNVRFKGADLSKAIFKDTSFEGVDLSGIDLTKTTFMHAVYDCATRFPRGFDALKAGLYPVHPGCGAPIDLSGKTVTTSMADLDLKGARLRGLRCRAECSFAGADLSRADLSKAAFDTADSAFIDTILDHADLSSADLGAIDYETYTWTLVSPVRAVLHAKSVKGTKLRGLRINAEDLARYAIEDRDLEDPDARPKPAGQLQFSRQVTKLMTADLAGSHLSCAPTPSPECWNHDDKEVAKLAKTIAARLRTAKGIIVDADCRSAP